jgi:hypothetical protein
MPHELSQVLISRETGTVAHSSHLAVTPFSRRLPYFSITESRSGTFQHGWRLNLGRELVVQFGRSEVEAMSRKGLLALRMMSLTLLIIATVWVAMWLYAAYQVNCARLMIAEASLVQIGDSEISVLPLVRRYGGFTWTPEPLAPKDNWIDKDEYDYQQNRVSDYDHVLEVSPFGTTNLRTIRRLTKVLQQIRAAVPVRLRPLLGMRDWGVTIDLEIRGDRVQSVSTTTVAEGKSG